MTANPINLCPDCVHAPYCVLTHNKSLVFSCSEFDELLQKTPSPIIKIEIRKPELETV